jgi:hypothetical protein
MIVDVKVPVDVSVSHKLDLEKSGCWMIDSLLSCKDTDMATRASLPQGRENEPTRDLMIDR